MAARFVSIDHDTPLLLPPDLRDWVPEDRLVHFIMETVGWLDLSTARVNHRRKGSEQYPPSMMLGLLIYCYATALSAAGASSGDVTLDLDGTKILASASKHSAVSHGHALKQMVLLEEHIAELLAKADAADSTPLEDGLTVPGEIARRRERLEKLREATAVIEARAKERHHEEHAAFEARQRERGQKQKATGKKPRGRERKPPQEGPRVKDQYDFTDADSRVMNTTDGFQQTYNAQAALEIQSRLVVSTAVSDTPNDKEQLLPTMGCVSPVIQSIGAVLIDSGFYSEAAVAAAEQSGEGAPAPQIYAATGRQPHGRTVAQPEARADPPAPGADASAKQIMAHRLATQAGRKLYAQRKQTIEPVFGIIKETMGFRRFSLRGLAKVGIEWTLVTLAYNLKRLFHRGASLAAA